MQRKKFKGKIIALIGTALILTGCSSDSDKQTDMVKYNTNFFAMDTYMNICAYGENGEEAAGEAVKAITELEKLLSVTDGQSEISAINNSGGNAVEVSDDTMYLLENALAISRNTERALDISVYPILREWGFTVGEYQVPGSGRISSLLNYVDDTRISLTGNMVQIPENMQIDLGSITKGYAGDKAIQALRAEGITSAIISLGGNVQTLGVKPDGSKWTVAVRDPVNTDSYLAMVKVSGKAVITSGGYERYFTDEAGNIYWHILNPHTGYPAKSGLVSVTVVGDCGMLCDALSTALFVMGLDKAVEYWRENKDFDMILVDEAGKVYITEELEPDFEPVGTAKENVLVINSEGERGAS